MEAARSELVRIMAISAALITASGFFILFTEALRAARKHRLQKEADDFERNTDSEKRRKGRNRNRKVLEAVETSERYFAAARVWVLVLRTLAVVIAMLNAGRLLEKTLPFVTTPAHSHGAASLFTSVPLITAVCTAVFLTVILLIGDLIPGIIARHYPERTAGALLPFMKLFVLPMRPFFFLSRITGAKLRRFFPPRPGMTEDELRLALMEGEKSGIVESKERTMVEGVFYLGDRPLGAFMTHRSEIQWLDIHTPLGEIRAKVLKYRQAQRCFPVAENTLDSIIGAAFVDDIIIDLSSNPPAGLKSVMKKAVFAPQTMPALKAFEAFRKGGANFLFVMDEYGGFAGMVSLRDLMEEIVGELTAPDSGEKPAVQREDGSWLVDGGLNIDDAARLFSLPGLVSADYHTLAGFVLSLSGEIPRSGDSFMYQDCRFTVMDMDSNRIGKIMVKKE